MDVHDYLKKFFEYGEKKITPKDANIGWHPFGRSFESNHTQDLTFYSYTDQEDSLPSLLLLAFDGRQGGHDRALLLKFPSNANEVYIYDGWGHYNNRYDWQSFALKLDDNTEKAAARILNFVIENKFWPFANVLSDMRDYILNRKGTRFYHPSRPIIQVS
jgi:hypothetical protein